MTAPAPTRAEEGREAGQVAYGARFADSRPRDVTPWTELSEDAKFIWARVEHMSKLKAEADAARYYSCWRNRKAQAEKAGAEVARLTAENERLHIAFLVLSESGHGGGMYEVRRWFNSGTAKPIPWPSGACFEAWAAEQGIVDRNGTMGFRRRDALQEGTDAP